MAPEPTNSRPADTLRRAVLWICAGGLLSALSFLFLGLLHAGPGHSALLHLRLSVSVLAVVFLGLIAGLTGLYWKAYTLKNDVQNERWSEQDLKPYRDFFQARGMTLFSVFLLVLVGISFLANRKFRFAFWPMIMLSNLQSQLSMAFKQPIKQTPARRVDWTRANPLQSDHWGER